MTLSNIYGRPKAVRPTESELIMAVARVGSERDEIKRKFAMLEQKFNKLEQEITLSRKLVEMTEKLIFEAETKVEARETMLRLQEMLNSFRTMYPI